MKLYIIGNGFDKAHELECSYWAFGDFIQEHYPQYYSCLMAAFNNDSGIWGDFETALPRCGSELENTGLNMMEERLGEIDYTPTDDEGIRFWLKEQYVFFRKLPIILREWVEYMCQKNVSPTYRPGVIDKDSLFLNFNYTRTLEKYYGIASDQICHIHGDVGNPEEILIMGHGSQKSIDYALKSLKSVEQDGATVAIAIYQCVVDCLELLFKDTGNIMKSHSEFFARLSDVDEVIVIGSSLSKADEPYFDMIERTTSAHWTFYYYNDDSTFKKFVESHRIAADRFSMVSDKEIKL